MRRWTKTKMFVVLRVTSEVQLVTVPIPLVVMGVQLYKVLMDDYRVRQHCSKWLNPIYLIKSAHSLKLNVVLKIRLLREMNQLSPEQVGPSQVQMKVKKHKLQARKAWIVLILTRYRMHHRRKVKILILIVISNSNSILIQWKWKLAKPKRKRSQEYEGRELGKEPDRQQWLKKMRSKVLKWKVVMLWKLWSWANIIGYKNKMSRWRKRIMSPRNIKTIMLRRKILIIWII